MANHESSKKRVRQTEKRNLRNRQVRTSVRGTVKVVRELIAAGKGAEAKAALADAVRRIDKAVTKGVYHRSTGSRYISRLSAQVAAL